VPVTRTLSVTLAAMQDDSADPLTEVNERARAYGLEVCGSEE
jgi:hypothetical protein